MNLSGILKAIAQQHQQLGVPGADGEKVDPALLAKMMPPTGGQTPPILPALPAPAMPPPNIGRKGKTMRPHNRPKTGPMR